DAAGAPHVVGHVAVGGHASDEMRAQVAMQDAGPIPWAQGECGADRDRLLSAPVVEGAGHLALLVEGECAFLGFAHHRHVAEEVRPILPRQGHVRDIAYALIRDSARVAHLHLLSAFRSGRAVGSPPTGPVSPLRDLRSRRLRTRKPRVPPRLPYVCTATRFYVPAEDVSRNFGLRPRAD